MPDPADPKDPTEPLGYASPRTPFLHDPFPSPRLTAWVTLVFTFFVALLAITGIVWVVDTVVTSDQPVGAFACLMVPVILVLIVMMALAIETVRSFRRARADRSSRR